MVLQEALQKINSPRLLGMHATNQKLTEEPGKDSERLVWQNTAITTINTTPVSAGPCCPEACITRGRAETSAHSGWESILRKKKSHPVLPANKKFSAALAKWPAHCAVRRQRGAGLSGRRRGREVAGQAATALTSHSGSVAAARCTGR